MEKNIVEIEIASLTLDPDLQPRASEGDQHVEEYAEAMKNGADFPPITVYNGGVVNYVADGHLRTLAARLAGKETILAEIRKGSKRDAMLHSVGANATHGIRRSNEDKRKSVKTVLRDPEWSRWSNQEIARRCAVSAPLVASIKEELREKGMVFSSIVEKKSGGTINTKNIGREKTTTGENVVSSGHEETQKLLPALSATGQEDSGQDVTKDQETSALPLSGQEEVSDDVHVENTVPDSVRAEDSPSLEVETAGDRREEGGPSSWKKAGKAKTSVRSSENETQRLKTLLEEKEEEIGELKSANEELLDFNKQLEQQNRRLKAKVVRYEEWFAKRRERQEKKKQLAAQQSQDEHRAQEASDPEEQPASI